MNQKRVDYRKKKLKQATFGILRVKPLDTEQTRRLIKDLDTCMNSSRRMPIMISNNDEVKFTYFDGSPKGAKMLRIRAQRAKSISFAEWLTCKEIVNIKGEWYYADSEDSIDKQFCTNTNKTTSQLYKEFLYDDEKRNWVIDVR